MSNPQFCFGYLSQQCAMIMSLDDAYYRKMFGSNDNFRHWTPGNSSTSSSTSSARQNYNTSSAHQNYGTTSPDHQNYNTSSARQKNNTSSAHQNYSTSSAHQNYSTTLPDHQFYGTSPVREKYNSTSRARPNFRPNVNNNNNDSATAFSKNRQSFGKVRSNSDKVMPGVRNGPKVQTNTYVKPSNYENRKQEVGDVYEKKPDVVFINGHSIQLAALPVISNGQSVYNPGEFLNQFVLIFFKWSGT